MLRSVLCIPKLTEMLNGNKDLANNFMLQICVSDIESVYNLRAQSKHKTKITSLNDYREYSNRLKPQIKKLVQSILSAGTNVVMDFPANTLSQRDWFRSIFSEIEAPHNLVYIDLPNDVCLKQIGNRRKEQPERAATDTPEMFEQVTKYFVAPTSEEGFNTIKVTPRRKRIN